MSLRTRVALICGGLTAVSAIVVGLVVLQFVEAELLDEVDGELARRAEVFQPAIADLVIRDSSLVSGLAPAIGTDPIRGSLGNQLLFEFGAVPVADPASGPGLDTIDVAGSQWRRSTSVVGTESPTDEKLVMELFEPLGPTLDRVNSIRRRAIGVAFGASLVGALLGYLLGRSVTRPLNRLVAQASAIEGSDGRGVRVDAGGNTEEVTELEAALNDLLARMNAALESARAFAADAAHELRTPLTAMAANIDVLNRRPDLDPAVRAEIVEELHERQAWLEQLLSSLRDLSKSGLSDPADTEELDLADLADAVVGGIERRQQPLISTGSSGLGPGDSLRLIASGPNVLQGIPESLRIMIDNLVRNAMAHGRSSDGSLNAEVIVKTDVAASQVVLIVQDAGPGIDEADRERLMKRFERGPTSAPGSGLGLALVDQQVSLHRGSLSISSAEMGGALVEVRLPAHGQRPA